MEMSENFMGIIWKNSPWLYRQIILSQVRNILLNIFTIICLCQKSLFKIFFNSKQIIGVNYVRVFQICHRIQAQLDKFNLLQTLRVTFVHSCSFMNIFDVVTQAPRSSKSFSTKLAIMVFNFVICFYMNNQFFLLTKGSATHITFKFFHFSMNNSNVLVFVFIGWKSLFTNFTCEIFGWIHFEILQCEIPL